MIYSSHTFELTLIVDTDKFSEWKDKAYKKSKGNHRAFEKNGVHYDHALKDKGIKIEYHDNTFKKKIKFIVFAGSQLCFNSWLFLCLFLVRHLSHYFKKYS